MKKKPLTGETFREIIAKNLLYADKTRYIYKMISDYKFCFLSRPRRFGKTLLIDAVEELFRGNGDLFKGLWINPNCHEGDGKFDFSPLAETNSSYAFQEHPVIRLNMMAYNRIEKSRRLKDCILEDLRLKAKMEGISLNYEDFGGIQKKLFQGLIEKYNGAKVAVLVDECDAPMANNINNQTLASKNSVVLADFYNALKKNREYIRFSLVTGVTRYPINATYFGPNMFLDISLKETFAGICGFTVTEFDALFADRMDGALEALKSKNQIKPNATVVDLRKELLELYGGYNWLGPEKILNPYSIQRFFNELSLDSYWTLSGQSIRLSTLISRKPMDFIRPKLTSYTTEKITLSDPEYLDPAAILFNHGYLTIDRTEMGEIVFTDGQKHSFPLIFLKIPNLEVKTSYDELCFRAVFNGFYDTLKILGAEFSKAFHGKDSKRMNIIIEKLFGKFVYWRHIPLEERYRDISRMALLAAGFELESEKDWRIGRSDIVVDLMEGRFVIIAIKYIPVLNDQERDAIMDKELNSALERIGDADYSRSLKRNNPLEIIGLGIVFYGKDSVKTKFWEGRDLRSPPRAGDA